MGIYHLGRPVTLAAGPSDGSAHEVTVAGTPYAIPAGQVGVILDDGRVIAVDPLQLTVDVVAADEAPTEEPADVDDPADG